MEYIRIGGVYENQTKSGMYFPIHKNAWTEERYKANETVSYPALSTTASASLRANEFFIIMGHRTKRILRVGRKRRQTY